MEGHILGEDMSYFIEGHVYRRTFYWKACLIGVYVL